MPVAPGRVVFVLEVPCIVVALDRGEVQVSPGAGDVVYVLGVALYAVLGHRHGGVELGVFLVDVALAALLVLCLPVSLTGGVRRRYVVHGAVAHDAGHVAAVLVD